MLKKVTIQGFRSIDDAEVEFRPLTVFFGPTASGKSSVFYSLLTLRNFILNPNQSVDGLFQLGFLNLGGFEQCVFNHDTTRTIRVVAQVDSASGGGNFGFVLGKADAEIISEVDTLEMRAKVPVPYAMSQTWAHDYPPETGDFAVNWNGFSSTVSPKTPTAESQADAVTLATRFNQPAEALRRIDVCPNRRGFFKPNYSPSALTPTPTTEDEVATLIINDSSSASRISIDTVEIFDRDFRLHVIPGTATVFLQTTEQTGARVPGYLVNDGFGVNQVVYMLAKIHRPESETILIEEPEVHLHPYVIRRLSRVMARLVTEENRQLAFTTHSEQFLVSILACLKEGVLSPDHVACYEVTRDGKKSRFARKEVSEDGRISGGLSSFTSAEMEDLKTLVAPRD
jgi:hypothetical protein